MKIISTMIFTLCFSSMMFASDNGMSSDSNSQAQISKPKRFHRTRPPQNIPYLKLSDSLAERDQQEEEERRTLELDRKLCTAVVGFTVFSFAVQTILSSPYLTALTTHKN